jgi:hypothetical protein
VELEITGAAVTLINALGSRLNYNHQLIIAARATAAAKLAANLS